MATGKGLNGGLKTLIAFFMFSSLLIALGGAIKLNDVDHTLIKKDQALAKETDERHEAHLQTLEKGMHDLQKHSAVQTEILKRIEKNMEK